MKVEIVEESGFQSAMLGLSLNKKQKVDNMQRVALNLGKADGGHNKFLETITVVLDVNAPRFFWSEFDTYVLDVNAPRFFWSEFDTYRVGVTKQSESTMHTLENEILSNGCFEYPINAEYIGMLNRMISDSKLKNSNIKIEDIKNALPDGFLQRRIVSTNYKTLRNIIKQRSHHKLPQWKMFCEYLKANLKYGVYADV